MRVADHAEHAFVLVYAVNGELGVEYFVAAMFAVGLRKHHQFYISGVATECGECIDQVVDFVDCQSQSPVLVGSFECGLSAH